MCDIKKSSSSETVQVIVDVERLKLIEQDSTDMETISTDLETDSIDEEGNAIEMIVNFKKKCARFREMFEIEIQKLERDANLINSSMDETTRKENLLNNSAYVEDYTQTRIDMSLVLEYSKWKIPGIMNALSPVIDEDYATKRLVEMDSTNSLDRKSSGSANSTPSSNTGASSWTKEKIQRLNDFIPSVSLYGVEEEHFNARIQSYKPPPIIDMFILTRSGPENYKKLTAIHDYFIYWGLPRGCWSRELVVYFEKYLKDSLSSWESGNFDTMQFEGYIHKMVSFIYYYNDDNGIRYSSSPEFKSFATFWPTEGEDVKRYLDNYKSKRESWKPNSEDFAFMIEKVHLLAILTLHFPEVNLSQFNFEKTNARNVFYLRVELIFKDAKFRKTITMKPELSSGDVQF
ncbi:hypothetical protein G210_4835 [Candida maltosa Xu316]|uniref:Uncharacterized protein n=1 Tax=Candida maltosa (strain Xu316) TaxID=1245528 RepID=M3IU79_CANMX|nr:hypothetical protein G210_4835 [Candida maltosa Xu316]